MISKLKVSGLLLTMILLMAMTPLTLVYPACNGSGNKRVATAENTNSGDHWGNYAENTPSTVVLCGSSWSEGSYAHLANAQVTEATLANWIEVMWYYGYTDYGASSTNSPAYQWIKYNVWDGGRKISDISAGTGYYPSFGDRLDMTLHYDWTDWLGRDYYKIIIDNIDKSHTITITNLWVNGRGVDSYLQSETFSEQNVLKGKQYYADYMDTSENWHDWSSAQTWKNPTQGNQLCVNIITNSNFKFGTIINGACSLP